MFAVDIAPENTEKEEGVPKMTEEQRETALDHIEDLKHGGDINLTLEEAKTHEETERLKGLQSEA